MVRRGIFVVCMILTAGVLCFGQAGALRDYVGLLSIQYHPDVVSYMGKFKVAFEKKGYTDAAKSIDNYLKGLSGSGFVHVAPDGTCYIITNEHVVSQSESLSITFEKQDGSQTIYRNLKVLKVDEEKDLAILYFDTGIKPFTQGLSFYDQPIDEGEDVFAAGFPGLGNTALWQFSRGTISNVSARLPKNESTEDTIGPFIQHTAQIDPGNSGGPLLEALQGAPAGYAVVGINTLSAYRRQAANYAIPSEQVITFIEAALSNEPENERQMVARKVDDFIKGLRVNKAVYSHISQFLTRSCTASNAEYAISELLEKAPRTVLEDIDETFIHNPVDGMKAAVAWLIENSMRSKSGTIRIILDSIEPSDKGGFIVSLNIDDKIVRSEWVKEYGVYRLDVYGDIAAGNKSLLDEKQRKQEQNQNLKTDFNILLSAGYANLSDTGSLFTASMRFGVGLSYTIDVYKGENNYLGIEMTTGFFIPIRLGSFAIGPFGDAGFGYIQSDVIKNASSSKDSLASDEATFNMLLQGGLMFTTSGVPGLYGIVYYKADYYLSGSMKDDKGYVFCLGYAF